jgi:hypothetical protein
MGYCPKPKRRRYIPKAGSEKGRSLGISSLEDKIVEEATKRTLEPIYEAVFEDSSHAYRPERNQHRCLDALGRTIRQREVGYVVESEVMRFQINPQHLSCFIHNFSPGRIGYRKYPLIRPNPFPGNVFLEAIRNLLRDEDNFPFLATLGGSESELSVLDITGCQFQDLVDPHPTSGHQFKN